MPVPVVIRRLRVEVAVAGADVLDEVEALLLHALHDVGHLGGTGSGAAKGRGQVVDITGLAERLEHGVDAETMPSTPRL